MAENDKGQALDWDVTEVVDDGGFTLLPAGTYAFEVAKIERERFEGSDKMEACPRAKVTLNVWTSQGWAPVVDRLMLNTKMAWRIARFFEGLGFDRDQMCIRDRLEPVWILLLAVALDGRPCIGDRQLPVKDFPDGGVGSPLVDAIPRVNKDRHSLLIGVEPVVPRDEPFGFTSIDLAGIILLRNGMKHLDGIAIRS